MAELVGAEDVPLLDVTAANMLAEVAAELERRGIQFVVAPEIASVSDLIRLSEAGAALKRVYPTVDAAVKACETGPGSGAAEPPPM